MSQSNRLWLLGPSTPAIIAIETLLRDAGEQVAYAVGTDGQRVHPGNAYRCDTAGLPHPRDTRVTVYLVECSPHPEYWGEAEHPMVSLDHHRPGDPGHWLPPERFLEVSSIGQVIAELARLGQLPDWPSLASWFRSDQVPAGRMRWFEDFTDEPGPGLYGVAVSDGLVRWDGDLQITHTQYLRVPMELVLLGG